MDAPTTVAMQTPPGKGGIAVIALAGPRTDEILAGVFRPWSARGAAGAGASAAGGPGEALRLGHVLDGRRVIDEAIVTRRGGAAEINIHGGPAAARAVLHLLDRLGATVLPAPPPDHDAFPTAHPTWQNPAIGAELLAALPAARSAAVLSALTQQWSAGLSRLARRTLSACDRPGDAPDAPPPGRLAEDLRAAAGRRTVMRRLLTPAEVVLAGPPNAGKSTLANDLVGREVSVVHDRAGTTRDWVRELALLAGLPVYVTDTAGLWDPPGADGIDAEAVRRARQRIARADLVLLLGAGRASDVPTWLGEGDRRPGSAADAGAPALLHVATKCDVRPPFAGAAARVSARTGAGLADLARQVLRALGLGELDCAAPAAFTTRQVDLLAAAADALDRRAPADARAALHRLLAG